MVSPDSYGPGEAGFNPCLIKINDLSGARRILEELGVDRGGVQIMKHKMPYLLISVENVQARATHIIKEVMLSRGGECATPREVYALEKEPVRVIMMGTARQFQSAINNLKIQPFGLSRLAEELQATLESAVSEGSVEREIKAGGFSLPLGRRTLVMGILNVTPDSFSDGGEYKSDEEAVNRAVEMVNAGADIIDVGGESTRPGSEPVTVEEEIRRTIPVIRAIAGEVDVPVSIDSYKSEVSERALDAGAVILNDVSGLRFDPKMIRLAAESKAPVIIMHMQGIPRNMQENPEYDDVVLDITRFLRARAQAAVDGGVDPGKIIVDPGIGFGKTLDHNLEIIRCLERFKSLGYPVLLGPSRKRFIGGVLDRGTDQRLFGTAATVALAVAGGADIVRVHDIEQMVDVVRMADAVIRRPAPAGQ